MFEQYFLFNCVSMLRDHAVPVAFAFESEFFSVLADFVKACKGNVRGLPTETIAGWVPMIVDGAFVTSQTQFDNTWSTDRTFKKLEASGILSECLRCMAVPQEQASVDARDEIVDRIVTAIVSCPSLLRKKFKEACLQGIVQSLRSLDAAGTKTSVIEYNLHRCAYCRQGSETPLMMCGRCKSYSYCSKECQRAHWKKHKEGCIPISTKDKKKEEIANAMVAQFVNKNNIRLKSKMAEECRKKGLRPHNMVIELDFMPNNDGIIPAMSDSPGNFTITPVRKIVNTKHPWLSQLNKELCDYAIDRLHAHESRKQKLPVEMRLAIYRYAGGVGCTDIAFEVKS
ncbi:unnamed protein product [Cylindrotheca closterium]|uniref:MYND-type domain-containing protein n=1 Tax=Cylindrotheca closterium TaxID=2856 RepID=A0AAD2FW87_9STRA|nr:unnamed protein product [Cylindrotheca closterium]